MRVPAKRGFPLHHEYGAPLHDRSAASQLEEALSILKEGHAAKRTRWRSITLNIGANDELAATLHTCEDEVKDEYEITGKSTPNTAENTPKESVINCIGVRTRKKTIAHILKNIGDRVRRDEAASSAGGGHYTRAIVLMG